MSANKKCSKNKALLAAAIAVLLPSMRLDAAITAAGNVTPAPPAAGGSVAGPFLVGDTATGTLAITGGTALTVTGNSTTVGDDATALGIVTLNGLGSDLTTANDLNIGNNGAGTVAASNLSRISIADDLVLGINIGASGQLDVNNFGAVVDVFDTVIAGNSGTAIIRVSGGGRLFADDSVIGAAALGNGRITVTGANSLWQQANSITVGEAGHGEVNLLDQARLQTTNVVIGNAATGVGVVNVSDAGSVWDITGFLNVGIIGQGAVNVLQGGRVATTSNVRIATIAAGEGHIVISGANSAMNIATTLTIGEFGFGTLSVLNGGRVTSTTAALGDDAGSRGEAIVDGNGSTWEIAGALDVSDPGQATLTISNGGLVKSTSTAIVRPAGQLVLDGGRLEAGGISGFQNQGLVRGGGTIVGAATNTATGTIQIETGDTLVLHNALSSSGLVSLRDGELKVLGATTNTGDIDIRNGTARFGSGLSNLAGSQLAIVGGEVDVFGAVSNAVGAQMVVGGQAHAALHDAFTNNGSLLITPGSELLTLENLTFGPASALGLPLAADGVTQVTVVGAAQVDGALEISLPSGFVPRPGDQFSLLTSAALSGTFDQATIPGPAGSGLQFHPLYSATDVSLLAAHLGDKTWGIDANGSSSVGSNWLGGVAPGGIDDKAAFTTIVTANRTVKIDAPFTAGSLYFDDDNSYQLSGAAAITLQTSAANARIDVKNTHGNGNHVISAPLNVASSANIDVAPNSSLTLSGPFAIASDQSVIRGDGGVLTITGPQSHAAKSSLIAAGGVTHLNSNAGANLALGIQSQGRVVLGADQDLQSLAITTSDPGIQGLDLNTPAIAGVFRSLRVHASDLAAAKASLYALIRNGISGDGIFDSGLGAHPNSAIGLAQTGGSILIRPTRIGDLNLDGTVSISDFIDLASHFNGPGTWQEGDLNYDNQVTISDFIDLASNFNSSYAGEVFPISDPDQLALNAFAAAHGVPEPAAITLLAAACGLALRKRRGAAH